MADAPTDAHPLTPPAMPAPDPQEFVGQVAVITAAAGAGIGEATARRLAAGGATVVVTDKHAGRTASVAATIGSEFPAATVVGHPLDVTDRDAMDAVVERVHTDFGSIDILVNNAAVNIVAPHFDYEPANWDWIVAANLSGPWYLCRRILPLMRESGRGGVVVNVSSYAPDVGGQGLESPYAITKGGLNVLTRSVAHEGAPYGIRAVTVSMGIVLGTRFMDLHPEILEDPASKGLLPWNTSAVDVAEAIAFAAGPRARCITGETINVASGSYMRN